tara:strand:- start:149 stop:358 length:210 start_codon:yes stop_codon:yes gene_type:complete
MSYVVIKVEWPKGSSALAKKVQEKIEEGFEPIGGMITWNDKIRGRIFAQTMIRKDVKISSSRNQTKTIL